MDDTKSNNLTENKNGTIINDNKGNQYFIFGKTRIKISEHFAKNGKSLDFLLGDAIQHIAAVS